MAEERVGGDELLGISQFPDYTPDEQRYSVHVRETMLKLLRGDLDTLGLLAKYHREPNRLGAMPVPANVNPKALRLPRVEEILRSTIRFLHDGTEGGPIAQSEDPVRGVIVQRRDFPTRFPHIVIERTDIIDREKAEPIETSWCVHRTQNQRNNVRLNRVLDAMNLGLSVLSWWR